MNEKPLERLNFFNGQRLQAEDLRVEQDYHMRVRRWLNRSLYTAGIASGLEVHKVPNAPKVRVGPGLALDNFGREIIHLEMQELVVPGTLDHHGQPAEANKPVGLYLIVRYAEEVTARQDAVCAGPDRPAAGGPSRVLAEPVFDWSPDPPHEESGKVLLAFVGLGKGCREVNALDLGVRRYVGAASAAKVKQYALEGERDVAFIPRNQFPAPIGGQKDERKDVSLIGEVVFHVRGRTPNSVTLYIRGRALPMLYYTELGAHAHSLSVTGTTEDPVPALDAIKTNHSHPAGTLAAPAGDPATAHAHTLKARKGYIGKRQALPPFKPTQENLGRAAFLLIERGFPVVTAVLPSPLPLVEVGISQTPEEDAVEENVLDDVSGSIGGGTHGHSISGATGQAGFSLTHKHSISGTGTSGSTGAFDSNSPNVVARSGKPMSFFHGLQIEIDGRNRTPEVLAQIARLVPPNEAQRWSVLGDATDTHPLVLEKRDAVPIRLDYLPGVVLSEGEHRIRFLVDQSLAGEANGGRIHFNLYVE